MDNETRADARVVKTVRRLRSTKPDQCQSGSMTAKNNENHNPPMYPINLLLLPRQLLSNSPSGGGQIQRWHPRQFRSVREQHLRQSGLSLQLDQPKHPR